MDNKSPDVVGNITQNVVTTLGLTVSPGTSIHIGQSNITHMENSHPVDYAAYGAYISDIIKTPDYVGINPKDSSIEYVKDFSVNGDYVKVAVRMAKSGIFYTRSIYILNPLRVQAFVASGTLKKP